MGYNPTKNRRIAIMTGCTPFSITTVVDLLAIWTWVGIVTGSATDGMALLNQNSIGGESNNR
jgi:hypothetical protein